MAMVELLAKADLRQKVEGRLGHSMTDAEWKKCRPQWGEGAPEEEEDEDVKEVIRKCRALRSVSSSSRPKPHILLYDDIEYQRAAQTSLERGGTWRWFVENARKDIWGAPEPPFSTIDYAELWMLRQDRFLPPLAQVPAPPGALVWRKRIQFQFPGLLSFDISPESEIAVLKERADDLASRMGCFSAPALKFILIDEIPILMSVTAEIPPDLARPLSLHINYPWVSRSTVYRCYTQFLNLRRALSRSELEPQDEALLTKSLRHRALTLLRFVAVSSELPWVAKYRAWNEEHPGWRYASQGSMQSAYANLRRRLKKVGHGDGLQAMLQAQEYERRGIIAQIETRTAIAPSETGSRQLSSLLQ